MTIITRFIGGTSIPQVLMTAERIHAKGYIPIFDYAKEGSKNVNDVLNYVREINKLVDINSDTSLDTSLDTSSNYAYALKLSSFYPYSPKETLLHVVNRIADKHEKCFDRPHIFLDAKKPEMKDIENVIIRSKYLFDSFNLDIIG